MPAANVAADGSILPEEALARSLQAYLSLPLEQYSVLDPKLVTRLAPGTDVEVYLSELLSQQKARRGQRKAAQQQAAQQQQGLQQILDSSSNSGSSNSSASGASLQPSMRQLPEPGGSSSSRNSISSTNGTTDPSAAAVSVTVLAANGTAAAATAAHTYGAAATGTNADGAAAAAEDEAAGAFLLRIPMLELLGIDLEPLLVIHVDIDEQHGQVRMPMGHSSCVAIVPALDPYCRQPGLVYALTLTN